jgi:outer membrane protein assembly factor BamB
MRSTQSLFLFLATLSAASASDNWPEYRGPQGSGLAEGDPPFHWSETENVRWKAPIRGKAWSSPVVWGDQVWVTTAPADGKKLWAIALDRHTGKVLFDIEVFDNPRPAFCIEANSYASSTPVIEQGRIYVHFGSAGTACLDTGTGKVLWARRDLPCDHFRGPASSPILYRDRLIINFDGADYQYVVALDKETGRTLWRKDRSFDYGKTIGDMKKAYGTPVVFDINGKQQLVSPAAFGTIAYDPMTGEEIWKVVHGGMNVAARPLYSDGRFYLCTGDGGWKLFAVRPGSGDVTDTNIEWKYNKQAPNRSSPILVGDHLYMVTEGGIVSCVDPHSGDTFWTERVTGKFWASPICVSGRLYLCDDTGLTQVADIRKGWKLLATNRLADGCRATPAVSGNDLILRTRTAVYCVGKTEK